VEESARAVYSKEGEIVVLIVCEDISERKESEKALQEWKTLTESVLGQLPKGFAYRCLNNKNWTAVYVSHGIEEVTGFPASALLNGKINYNSLLAPGENERVWANVQEALAQHLPYENEHQIITSDGTTKWILARGRFIFDDAGQLLYLDGLNVDITEQKQIEKALRTSEARFRSLIEHVPFGIHEIELSGKISSMNKSGQHMMGIENESQVIGHSYLKFTEEKDHDRIRDFFEQALQGQPVDFELNETTHGKLRYFTKSFVPIRGREGTVLKIVGISEEITERKEAEKQLLDSEAKRIDALRQSDELKSALLASVSHELRTPLTAMKGSVSSIIGNSSVSKDQKREEALKGIDREINYMSHLVDNLLDMSQIEAGTLIPHKEWHLLEDLMEGALRRAAQTLDTRNIAIDIPENVPPIFVDAVEIQQVLMNLIDNAVKYSSPHSPIQLLARIDPQQIEVMVSNTGEPIQAQDLERIFERFYRRRSPREEPIRGTGLGLAICKGIIEAHGGRIWAESVGKEVIITFTIPTTESMADFSLEGLHKR
jgi:PAS domain S-box-containing protein